MIIEIISVSGVETPAGKKYQTIEIGYKSDGKIQGKKLLSFANPTLFNQAQKWKQGDQFDIVTRKDDNGYWQWIEAVPATVGGSGGSVKSVGDFKKQSEDRFESREERLARQRYIVRQSSISNAISVLLVSAKSAPATADILALAKKFEEYVFAEEATAIPDITEIEDDFPE